MKTLIETKLSFRLSTNISGGLPTYLYLRMYYILECLLLVRRGNCSYKTLFNRFSCFGEIVNTTQKRIFFCLHWFWTSVH